MIGNKISKEQKKILNEILKKYPNVVGFSNVYQKKIVKGQETETPSLRIYVSKKIDKKFLADEFVIPKSVDDIPTDVVEIGEVKALSLLPKAKNVTKTQRNRPVKLGVSIGNWSITAGTSSVLMKDKYGELYVSSNAHVFTDGDSSKPPEEISERKIVQPGKYDGGTLDDWVASYEWHKQVFPNELVSNCPIGKFVCGSYNLFAKLFGRKTRLVPVVEGITNQIDFAVAKPLYTYFFQNKLFDEENIENIVSVGLLFAGSDTATIVCKMTNIIKEGYYPIEPFDKVVEARNGMTVWKTGRTTCKTSGTILDENGVVNVSYGKFMALFDDVIISDMKSQGGDSGSFVWSYE